MSSKRTLDEMISDLPFRISNQAKERLESFYQLPIEGDISGLGFGDLILQLWNTWIYHCEKNKSYKLSLISVDEGEINDSEDNLKHLGHLAKFSRYYQSFYFTAKDKKTIKAYIDLCDLHNGHIEVIKGEFINA